jgi:hypothetical protein
MTTVSSLVVQRRLATLRQVEEALARQVLYGGDVVTNLLEVAPPPSTDEEQLTIALADALGIAPASIESMRAPDSEAVFRVPRALAEEHGFVPIARAGDALVVALAEPLAESTVQALREKLGPLKQVAAPLFRLRQALERAYGVPMDRRTKKLAATLDGGESPADSTAPPPSQLAAVFTRTLAMSELGDDAKSPRPTETPRPAVSKDPSRPPPATTIRTSLPGPSALQWFLKGAQERASAPNPQVAPPSPIAPPVARASSKSTPRFSLSGRKRRGPFTRAEAEETLASADRSEVVFAALFEFVQQYVTYTALFLVKEDIAEGWDAHGPGASGDRVRKMGVPLDLPSLFAAALGKRLPILHKGVRGELDEVILADLDRAGSATDVIVVPVLVGKRVVALLYGDDANEPMTLDELSDVIGLAASAGAALGKIIIKRKTKGTTTIAPPPVAQRPAAPIASAAPPAKATAPAPTATSTSRQIRAQRMRPNRPDLATRAHALAAALTGGRKPSKPPAREPAPEPTVVPHAIKAISVAPPALHAAPPIVPGGEPRTATPPPYKTISGPPAPVISDHSPVPERRQTIPRMPAMPRVDEPQPTPGRGRTTDPLFKEQHVPTDAKAPASPPPPAPSIEKATTPESPLPRRTASIARIELRTIALAAEAEKTPVQEPAHAEIAAVASAQRAAEPVADVEEGPSHADAALAALADAASSGPTPTGPEPSMPMPPPPLLTGKRKLAPPIPREEPMGETPSSAAPTPGPRIVDKTPPPLPTGPTSEPDVIEAAEVTEEELEELLAEAAPSYREGERVEAYPPRPPPRPQPVSRDSRELPKVIVALDPEVVALVDRLMKGGEAGEAAKKSLQDLGVSALAAIMSRFPGPTRADRTTPPSQLPAPGEAGPLLSLLTELGRLALREILARVSDPEADTRFWATYLLTDIIDPESAPALVPRLVDDDPPVRRVAAFAARALVESLEGTSGAIVDPLVGVVLDAGATPELRVRSALALGDVRDARAAEGLILGLESYEKDVGRACHDALCVLACTDPTRQGGTWPAWFSANKDRSRIEWLIDALMDEEEPTREAAAAELKARTKMYFGYYANLSRGERQGAQRRYRTWWETEGRAKLAPR